MLQQVSTSLAYQHSLPHHSHPGFGTCVLSYGVELLSTSVGLFASLGYNCIPALGNGYQTTTEKTQTAQAPLNQREAVLSRKPSVGVNVNAGNC